MAVKRIWKACPRFSQYEVSNYGEVRHKKKKELRTISPHRGSKSYLPVCSDGHRDNICVEESIWEAFKGPIPEGYWVRKKDADHENRKLSNLVLVPRVTGVKAKVAKIILLMGKKDLEWARKEYKYHSRDGKSLKALAEQLDISESGLWRAFNRNNSIKKRFRPLRKTLEAQLRVPLADNA